MATVAQVLEHIVARRALARKRPGARARKQAAGFLWDAAIARGRNRATGRLVSEQNVFEAAEGFREFSRQNIEDLTGRFLEGDIDLSRWQQGLADEVRDQRLISYMAGRGGRHSMTQADFGRVGGRLQFDYRKLNDFAREVKQGNLTRAQIKARADLYGQAATQSYNDGVTAAQEESQRNLRWEVGPTEHCADCLRLNGQVHSAQAWSASGWQPQSRTLECGGFRCQCRLVPTDEEERGEF